MVFEYDFSKEYCGMFLGVTFSLTGPCIKSPDPYEALTHIWLGLKPLVFIEQ